MRRQNQPLHYGAFISYRHLSPDKEIAHALHKLLEHNMVRPNRKVPRNIRPVFLDTMELPLVEDLDQGIKDALDHSECLIVVCSPNLPLSKYCMEEIRYFKQQHGGSLDRVYTILADGEPMDAFPQLLRTKTIRSILPDGTQIEEEVPAEPLFADVRGKTLFHSYWKLFKSEYLRIAAAYYRCRFDDLYKRYQRWIASVAVTAVLALGLVGYGFLLNSRALKTDAITSHAVQCLETDDELLAMTLCGEAEYTASQRYQAALRSAVVQYDYKHNAVPVSSIRLASFLQDFNSVRYLSAGGNQIVTKANAMLQITDAATGFVYIHEPQDHVFVTEENPETYIRLHSHMDEEGVMRDYVSLHSLEDHSLIREFSYRESDRNSSSYRLIRAVETDTLLTVSDGDRSVAFMTSDGRQLTEEEYIQLALDYVDAQVYGEDSPYNVVRDKRLQKYVVKDKSGVILYELGGTVKAYDLSDDGKYFAWMDNERIYVLDTTDWTCVSKPRIYDSNVQKLHLLRNSTYFITFYLDEGESIGTVYDWKSGNRLASFTGTPMFSREEQAFFIAEDGKITRYEYRDLAVDAQANVLAHAGERSLAAGNGRLILIESGAVQLETAIRDESDVSWNRELSRILIRNGEGLACYRNDGTVIWTVAGELLCSVIAEDGSAAAWMDADGVIHIADGKTGTEQRKIDKAAYAAAGEIYTLAVSEQGVCVAGTLSTLWIPADGGECTRFNTYSGIRLYADGILILEDMDARVLDFMIYDTAKGKVVYQPESNTGIWDYSSETGYLIRHVQTSGNNPTMNLELLQRRGSGFISLETITVPSDYVSRVCFDSTGCWISIQSGGQSIVYRIKGMEKWLDAACSVYYESGTVYADRVYGTFQYTMPVHNVKELAQYASEALKSDAGIRTLTEDERIQYGIQ